MSILQPTTTQIQHVCITYVFMRVKGIWEVDEDTY